MKKRQRRLTDVDEIVLSLYAKGMTTGEISAHWDCSKVGVFGPTRRAEVRRDGHRE